MGEAVNLACCPFCGSSRVDTYFVRDGRRAACECGASIVRFHGKEPDTDAVVRAAWNRRSPPAPVSSGGGGWEPMETAPENERLLVNFKGAGPIVAYRDPEQPYQWVRYVGYGKSRFWPTVHEDFALGWQPLPPVNDPAEGGVS